jgi:hypothetical protein
LLLALSNGRDLRVHGAEWYVLSTAGTAIEKAAR